jgi:hypothetical protein
MLKEASEPIRGGMSGSPVLVPDGAVIGVVCLSAGSGDDNTIRTAAPTRIWLTPCRGGACVIWGLASQAGSS